MNAASPSRGSRKTSGRRPSEVSRNATPDATRELRAELRGRLQACLAELKVERLDLDVIETLLRGALEAIEASK